MIDQYKFATEFAEYVARNHFVLVNQIGKLHYWKNELDMHTTEQLMSKFVKSKQKQ